MPWTNLGELLLLLLRAGVDPEEVAVYHPNLETEDKELEEDERSD